MARPETVQIVIECLLEARGVCGPRTFRHAAAIERPNCRLVHRQATRLALLTACVLSAADVSGTRATRLRVLSDSRRGGRAELVSIEIFLDSYHERTLLTPPWGYE
jgi:hypothetical protein